MRIVDITGLDSDGAGSARVSVVVLSAVLASVLLWASAFVGIRVAGRHLGPGELTLGRLAVSSLALGALMLARRERLPRGRALWLAVVSGLLWFGAYNLALNAAERQLDAGTASLLVNTGPVLIALLAGAFLREGYPPRLLAGCAVSFAGVGLIAFSVSGEGLQATSAAGLCLLAALVYAAGVVVQKPALSQASALATTFVACAAATVCCLPWLPSLASDAARVHAGALLWTVYLGLGPSAAGFGCWAFALARSSAGRLGVSTYVVPPLTVLLSWVLLGQAPPLLAAPGGALCLAGVALARSRAHRPG
jgi:drug/metabolite transporter (DMT)-like permease